MTTRSVSEDSVCDCGDPSCEKPLYLPIALGRLQDGPKRAFDASESSSGTVALPQQ